MCRIYVANASTEHTMRDGSETQEFGRERSRTNILAIWHENIVGIQIF